MSEYLWKVVPICERQRRDVNESDLIRNGLYRRCDIYKGGGGYDKFEDIYRKRNSIPDGNYSRQFVVQLHGCPLRCPYCYVTEDGIHAGYALVGTEQLVKDFKDTGLRVFHLMGGAPALYIEQWADIIKQLEREACGIPFHSDLLCVEKPYDDSILEELAAHKDTLYAVSIKGATQEEFKKNTGVELDTDLFWDNFTKLVKHNIPFYITYTGMDSNSRMLFETEVCSRFPDTYNKILEDSFSINLVHYKALE